MSNYGAEAALRPSFRPSPLLHPPPPPPFSDRRRRAASANSERRPGRVGYTEAFSFSKKEDGGHRSGSVVRSFARTAWSAGAGQAARECLSTRRWGAREARARQSTRQAPWPPWLKSRRERERREEKRERGGGEKRRRGKRGEKYRAVENDRK